MSAKAIFKLVKKGDAEALDEVLCRDKEGINDAQKGLTALMMACGNGDEDVVDVLLSHNPNLNAREGKKPTALMIACEYGFESICMKLLKKKADSRVVNESGENLMHIAVRSGMHDLLEELLRKKTIKTDDTSEDGAPLHLAVRQSDTSSVGLLLAARADPSVEGPGGSTPLMIAAQGGDSALVRGLLEAKAAVNAQNALGWTCLHVCTEAWRGKATEVEALLIEAGADPGITNDEGLTAAAALQAATMLRSLGTSAAKEGKADQGKGAKPDRGLGEETRAWLEENGLGALQDLFSRRKITKESALEINAKTMAKLKVPMEHRTALGTAIRKQQEEVAAEEAAEREHEEEAERRAGLSMDGGAKMKVRMVIGLSALVFFALIFVFLSNKKEDSEL